MALKKAANWKGNTLNGFDCSNRHMWLWRAPLSFEGEKKFHTVFIVQCCAFSSSSNNLFEIHFYILRQKKKCMAPVNLWLDDGNCANPWVQNRVSFVRIRAALQIVGLPISIFPLTFFYCILPVKCSVNQGTTLLSLGKKNISPTLIH